MSFRQDYNSIKNGVGTYYTFRYNCPGCGVLANIRLPMDNGILDDGWIVECRKCGHKSRPAHHRFNIIGIYRCLNDNINEEILHKHNIKVLADSVSACAAIIINADNIVKREEIRAYKEFCLAFFEDEFFDFAKERLKYYIANTPKAYKIIEKLKNAKPELKELLLELMCDIASCDGDFAESEKNIISKLVIDLDISETKWDELKEKYSHTGDEYNILGINSNASFNEIKEAYHKKCKEFHPDLYLNLPQSFQDFANKKFKEVQEAYEKLRKRYEK